jgi:DNA-binding NtrC family response regulator
LGGDRELKADVRIVAATNVDLEQRIRDGRFRQDLYYRLARFTVCTPPLRERRGDIRLLARHFLRVFSLEMTRAPPVLGAAALHALERYDFPGNVRELKNVIERALINCDAPEICPGHLALPERSPPRSPEKAGLPSFDEVPLNLQAAERFLIERALGACKGNVAVAARMLGVPRMRIYRRLRGGEPAA